MSAAETEASHPGLSVGPTSEFSLFFRVKRGEGEALRGALRDLQDTPVIDRATTTWRSRRSMRPGSCCSMTTRGSRS